ncbi:MAG: GNAT family N-acetyltransferase [Salibacteraceae bacterium]
MQQSIFHSLFSSTERLVFRELEETDADWLFEIYSDKEAMKYRGSVPLQNRMEAIEMVRNVIKQTSQINAYRLGIVVKPGLSLIGTVLYKTHTSNTEICEIGFSLDKNHWGKGYATELVSSMLINFKKQKEFKELHAWVVKENSSSVRLFEKLGFHIQTQNQYPHSFLFVYK